jgi:hypothetical protein
MATQTREVEALERLVNSFEQLIESCEGSEDRAASKAVLKVARELYGPVRELAEEIRHAHGEVPSLRAGIARLDQALN